MWRRIQAIVLRCRNGKERAPELNHGLDGPTNQWRKIAPFYTRSGCRTIAVYTSTADGSPPLPHSSSYLPHSSSPSLHACGQCGPAPPASSSSSLSYSCTTCLRAFTTPVASPLPWCWGSTAASDAERSVSSGQS